MNASSAGCQQKNYKPRRRLRDLSLKGARDIRATFRFVWKPPAGRRSAPSAGGILIRFQNPISRGYGRPKTCSRIDRSDFPPPRPRERIAPYRRPDKDPTADCSSSSRQRSRATSARMERPRRPQSGELSFLMRPSQQVRASCRAIPPR